MAQGARAKTIESLSGSELEDLVAALLEDQGFVVHREQRIGEHQWDMVAYGPRNQTIIVEVKRSFHRTPSRWQERLAYLPEGYKVLLAYVRPILPSVRSELSDVLGDQELEFWEPERLATLLDHHPRVAARFGLGGTDGSGPTIARLCKLRLENIRGFRELSVDFGPSGQSKVVIGPNSTGKTTLLRAIAIALASFLERSTLLAQPIGELVREGEQHAMIEATVLTEEHGERTVTVTLERQGHDRAHSSSDNIPTNSKFVCGYGVGRTTTQAGQPSVYQVHDAVASLFDYRTHLADPELILRRLQDDLGTDRYAGAIKGLLRVLDLDSRYKIYIPRGGGVHVSGPGIGKGIPLEGWADGYRMTFQWLLDFYGWALQANAIDRQGHIHGILLVDELEKHLHPSMQTGLLSHLSRLLPKVQIIATTHSPLVALGGNSRNIISLHRARGYIRSVRVPDLTGYSAEDILVEQALFGTDPHSPTTRKLLAEHRKLAKIPKSERSDKQRARLVELARQLDPSLGPGLRNDPVLERLDELERQIEAKKASE
ncbi:MAG: AAA family ATPase [Myxococcota bacterium]